MKNIGPSIQLILQRCTLFLKRHSVGGGWALILSCFLAMTLSAELSARESQDNQVALTFDDLPFLGPLGFWRAREVSNTILRTLDQHHIPAAGFVVEEKIDDDTTTYVVLEDWVKRGHVVGHHTYSHVDLNQLNAKDFLQHVADGQKYLWRLSKVHAFNFRYLRFPYLHQGDTQRKKKRVAKGLERRRYEIAHVTIKTSDHRFSSVYIEKEPVPESLDQLKTLYLEHISAALDYAETQSQAVFGRNIRHILRLHCSVATAHFLADLITMLINRSYTFISFPEALSDAAFASKDNYAGPLGLSFIDRIAATRGLPFSAEQGELTDAEIRARLAQLRNR